MARAGAPNFQRMISNENLVFEIGSTDEPLCIDSYQWKSLIADFIAKAVQYPCMGNLCIRVEELRKQVSVCVSDTGTGMELDEFRTIFPKLDFLVSDSAGSGVGVPVIIKLLQRHAERMYMESESGENNVIRITLLKRNKHFPGEESIEREVLECREESGAYLNRRYLGEVDYNRMVSQEGERIMIVEDNPEMNRFIRDTLAPFYHVINAHAAPGACEVLGRERPDLVILDMLPVPNGYDLLAWIKKNKRFADMPVVLLSGRKSLDLATDMISKGADDYLVKPFTKPELLMRVKTQLDLARNRCLVKDQQARLEKNQIAQKDEFISIAGHELKTPLTTLRAYTELLGEQAGDLDYQTLQKYLGKSTVFVKRLNKLVNDLLDVTRIRTDSLKYAFDFFDFRKLMEESVEVASCLTSKHTFFIEDELSVSVYGDRERLGQVLQNLMSNAIKYSPNGGSIALNCNLTKKQVIVSVQDEGVGVSKENRKIIFERYARGRNGHQISGIGIGLFISAKIIERHNGKIWVESDGENGSTFYFSLPIKNYNVT